MLAKYNGCAMATISRSTEVCAVFDSYTKNDRLRLQQLRSLVLMAAYQINPDLKPEESLKWGQPSYVVPGGSPIRLGWSKKEPQGLAVFFHCQTSLVENFKALYGDRLSYEGKRAIVFPGNDPIPEEVVSHCLTLALTYHSVKQLPHLGAIPK